MKKTLDVDKEGAFTVKDKFKVFPYRGYLCCAVYQQPKYDIIVGCPTKHQIVVGINRSWQWPFEIVENWISWAREEKGVDDALKKLVQNIFSPFQKHRFQYMSADVPNFTDAIEACERAVDQNIAAQPTKETIRFAKAIFGEKHYKDELQRHNETLADIKLQSK